MMANVLADQASVVDNVTNVNLISGGIQMWNAKVCVKKIIIDNR